MSVSLSQFRKKTQTTTTPNQIDWGAIQSDEM
jgi:hypothetical protein